MVRLTKKASETMKRGPGVHKRPSSNVWHWGIKAPADLRSQYPTQWAHRCTLTTTDLREANEKACKLHAAWLERFAEQRRSLNPQRLEKVGLELAKVLAQRVGAKLLAADDRLRSDPATAKLLMTVIHDAVPPAKLTIGSRPQPAWLTIDVPADPLEGMPGALAAELARVNEDADAHAAAQWAMQRTAAVLPLAQAEGRAMGFDFDAKTPGAAEALRECLKEYRKALHGISLRDRGEVIETPAAPTVAHMRQAQPVTLRQVFERWKAVKKRSADYIGAVDRALSLFEQRTGNTPVRQITRAQGDDFRAWLQTLGTSSKTAHSRITDVKSLLVYACRDLELIPRQPWEGIDVEYRTENKRRPWSAEEMGAFFGLPLFTRYELPSDPKAGGDAAYWVPLLGLYTGARVGELCQLRVSDIETGKHGAFIRITDEAEGAKVKTEAGLRRVPVHSALVRLGFLDYVETIRKTGAGALWPHMRFRKGKPGGYFSDWVNAFHKSETVNPEAPVFHALRHTVRSALLAAREDRAIIGLVIGHETGLSDAELTYSHVYDEDLRKAIERLKFPGAKLRRMYPTP